MSAPFAALTNAARRGDAEAALAIAELGRTFDAHDGSPMVVIPGGAFERGPGREQTELPLFAMAQHPVTNEQFATFLDASGYAPDPRHPHADRYLAHWNGPTCPASLARHPVVGVSFVDAWHYCRHYGLELPSESMWEKAARGTDARWFPWGSALPSPQLCRIHAKDTCAVGSYPNVRTAYGCQDMVGNVSELCTPDGGVPGDPREITTDFLSEMIVVRGSAYLRQSIRTMYCTHSRRLRCTNRNRWVGFRPALRFGA